MSKITHDLQNFQEYLEELINKSPIKKVDMAQKLGYENPNLITMFKKGQTRVPMEKIPLFAKILNIDPKVMLRRYLCEYHPLMLRIIEQYFGAIITQNEQHIIDEIRMLSNGIDPSLTSIKSKLAIDRFVKEITL